MTTTATPTDPSGPPEPSEAPPEARRSLAARILLAPLSRRTWAQYLYAVVTVPLGIFGLVYVLAGLSAGAGLSVTFIGLPLIAALLMGARFLGSVHRELARKLLKVDVGAPPPRRAAEGVLARLGAALSDAAGWRAMAYLLIRAPISVLTVLILTLGTLDGLTLLTYPIWWSLFDVTQKDSKGVKHHAALQLGNSYVDTMPKALVASLVGAVFLIVTPWLLRAVLWADNWLRRGLLGPTKLAQRVVDLTQSRAHAVEDSAAKLRRIERDLHDGAQAQLVALAMQLGEAKENLENLGGPDGPDGGHGDLAETRALIDTAHRNAKQAITELRDLARGIHPPALDNGLGDALGTLAARSALPVRLTVDIRDRPDAAIEAIAYFCAAELLTNAAKHGRATRVDITVSQVFGLLRVRVGDDGIGGARISPAGGLAGLIDRVKTVDGRLTVDSPAGGPTVALVELPSQM